MSAVVTYSPRGAKAFTVVLEMDGTPQVTLSGDAEGTEPTVEGTKLYAYNQTLIDSLWAYGVQENAARSTRSPEKKKAHKKAAESHARMTKTVADLLHSGLVNKSGRSAWCSSCFQKTRHYKVDDLTLVPPAYLCQKCGGPTARCVAPRCDNMAVRLPGTARVPRYCAEHRHDISSFPKLTSRLSNLDRANEWLEFDKRNLASATRIATVATATAVVFAPGAFVAAPAVGGILGASALGGSLSGAAAVSHGLAMLGLGSVASGGFGMAGGTAVVVAGGSLLGARLGGAAAAAYAGDDKSFAINKVKDGSGTPVVFASGFLTQGEEGWGEWERIITERYPTNPVYRVQWGSKELRAFVATSGRAAAKETARRLAKMGARAASKQSAKVFVPLTAAMVTADFVANPWHVAKVRADRTGAALADILARTGSGSFILVGHSLGARVMAVAATALGSVPNAPRLEEVHLLGAAIASVGDWHLLNESVSNRVWNYYSDNDQVLRKIYRAAQGGQKAAGVDGLKTRLPRIKNVNVTKSVGGHTDYLANVHLK